MKKLIRVLAVLSLASLICLVSIVALSLASDLFVDFQEPSTNRATTKVLPSPAAAEPTIITALKPTATDLPIVSTLEPKDESLDKLDYIDDALIYMDSLLSISNEVANNLTWLSETVLLATDYKDLYTICAIGESNIDLSISKLLALEPTKDLEAIHVMFLNAIREFKTAMNECSFGDFDSFFEHMEIGMNLLDNATTLMDLWIPAE